MFLGGRGDEAIISLAGLIAATSVWLDSIQYSAISNLLDRFSHC